jgi:hypothetical protein
MKTSLMKSLLAVGALSLLGGCDSDQPVTTCRAAGGGVPFAVKNTLVERGANCTDAQIVPGQLVSLASYDAPGSAVTTLAAGVEGIPAYTTAGIPQLAQGEFTAKEASAENFCSVPTMTTLTAPDNSISYQFSNIDIYVSAANQGTQFRGDLRITQGACVSTYRALGLWPDVACETDADCGEGSGINPDLFESVSCDLNIGFCMLRGNDIVKTGGDL